MTEDREFKTLEEVEAELRRRKRENPLEYVYDPHQFQEEVHRDRHEITLVLGGNRTGKTYSAVAEALFYCLGKSEYAEIPDPPNTVWYVVPTSDTFVDAVEPIIEELVPPGEINKTRGHKLKRYTFKNGSTLVARSADQRQKRMTGASVDLVVIDEPISKKVYDELTARLLSTQGRVLKVMTPVDEKADKWLWVRDELYVPWQSGERPDVHVVHMPIADDEGEPLVPHMSRADVERAERQWPDPQTRAARMYGEFVLRSGLVFSTFDPDVHLMPRFQIPDNWTRWLVCDPQYHRFAVLYFAADDKGNYYVTDEYFSVDEPLAKRAERIQAMVGQQETSIPMYVDYANPQDITELNYHFNRISADIGAVQLPMQKRVHKMILRTHSMLEPNEKRPYHDATPRKGVHGAPRLLFFDDLQSTWKDQGRTRRGSRLTWEMQKLTWGRNSKLDKDSAGGADCCDCLIYGCSVMARGTHHVDKDDWKEDLSPRDRRLWTAIEIQDKMNDRRREWTR